MTQRLKTSIHNNLLFHLCVGSIALFGLILLVALRKNWSGSILGVAMACSNTFGLVTGAFLLGFGLSELPKSIWRNADWTTRQKVLSNNIVKMAVKLDDAHQVFSNAIVITQATSKQISKRDPLRRYMNVIDKMLFQMLQADPSFKPQGGKLGENDMDYDTDEKSMATLRRCLKRAKEQYYRYRSEYTKFVLEALELEDTIKCYEHRNATGWKYISSIRPERTGKLGYIFDTIEFVWRCILRKQFEKSLAVVLFCMSFAILLAEATILPSGVDLSFFSILIHAAGKHEVLVQIAAFIPLMYMCICTYYSLFKMGMMMFYSLTPRQTNSVSLLMICSMVARYAPPISYNFLNLIHLDGDAKTIFEKRMGNIDDAVPFFGKGFNKIYPLIMVVYTLLLACNFFDRVINYFGTWKRLKFNNDEEYVNGFDPSGVIILQKERSLLEQGHKVGEQIIPLARNFSKMSFDVESASESTDKNSVQYNSTSVVEGGEGGQLISLKEGAQTGRGREATGKKYVALNTRHDRQVSDADLILEHNAGSLNDGSETQNKTSEPSLGLSSTWETMKTGLRSLRSNFSPSIYLSVPLANGAKLDAHATSSEYLDEIFERLKQPSSGHVDSGDGNDNYRMDLRKT